MNLKALIEQAQAGDIKARNAIVEKLMPIVKVEADKAAVKRGAESGEYITAGFLALCWAIEHFDLDRETRFEAYVVRRIRGEIMDQERREGRLSRRGLQAARELESARETLRKKLSREPRRDEVKAELGEASLKLGERALAFRPKPIFAADYSYTETFAREAPWQLGFVLKRARRLLAGITREAFNDAYRRGLSASESSKRLGVSTNCVCKALRRSVKAIITGETTTISLKKAPDGRRLPLGYVFNAGQVIVEPNEALTVRLAFRRYATTEDGVAGVARWLNEGGYKTLTGRPWTCGTVGNILRQAVYCGSPKGSGKWADYEIPRIVRQDVFEEAARLRSRKKTREVAA